MLHHCNGDCKQTINICFILTQIFKMMKLQFKNIPIYSKRMLAFYNQYWCKTQTLISDDIKTIIWRQNLIFLNTPYPFCQVKDTYIDDDIIKNPQLSQIILIITWFASHRGLQANQYFFIWCVSKGHSLVFPKNSLFYYKSLAAHLLQI